MARKQPGTLAIFEIFDAENSIAWTSSLSKEVIFARIYQDLIILKCILGKYSAKTTTRHGFRRFVVEEADIDRVDSTREGLKLNVRLF